jgi:SEC-C motif-containing protein
MSESITLIVRGDGNIHDAASFEDFADKGPVRISPAIVLAALAATLDSVHVPVAGESGRHRGTKGHICGRDMGKPARQIQPRNAKCLCGSGRKAKRCCVYVPQQLQSAVDSLKEST